MGKYLDRLNAEFDELTAGVTAVLERAADANRELEAEEQTQIARDDTRRDELTKAIEHYTALEERTGKVTALRSKVAGLPAFTRTTPDEPEYDIAREYPSAGHYAIDLHRAMYGDRDARERIDRATAHQTTADNPGLIPRPILGEVVNMIDAERPFITAIGTHPLPTGSFDRPKITQHVAIDKQTAEKTETASRKLLIGKMPVEAATYAGHLNISRQDVKWTSPAILNIVYADFATIYAQETEKDANALFLASLVDAPTVPIDAMSQAAITAALYAGVAESMRAKAGVPDALFASLDVWAQFGGMTNPMGAPAFPGLSLTNTAGNPLGLKLVVGIDFPPGTLAIGPSRRLEWYEDLDGLMSVEEPNVLGQLVGYAGYGAFLNVAPEAFTVYEVPPADGGGGTPAAPTVGAVNPTTADAGDTATVTGTNLGP